MPEGVQLIEVMARTKSGEVAPFHVQEIISIDGKPYSVQGQPPEVLAYFAGLEGRIAAIESILGQSIGQGE